MDLKKVLEPYKEKINHKLKEFLDYHLIFDHSYLKYNPKYNLEYKYGNLKNYLLQEGKRLRPLLCVLAYNAVNGDREEIYDAAISLELFHNSTLIHDDIMDEDDKRRNQDTIHISDSRCYNKKDYRVKTKLFSNKRYKFGVSSAIISGDFCFALGQIALIDTNFDPDLRLQALKVYNKVYNKVCIGQDLDIIMENDFSSSEKDYLEMIKNKTGELIRASVEIGLILGDAESEERGILLEYSELMGLAFQIKDDLMSISRECNKGHEFGEDIKQNKTTLLLIKALELADNKKELLKLLNKNNKNDKDVNKIIGVFYKNGAVDYCKDLCEKKVEEAKNILSKGNFNKDTKEILIALADFFKDRKI